MGDWKHRHASRVGRRRPRGQGPALGARGQVLRAVREAAAPAPTSQMKTRQRSSETC